jgi:hypothetical protein
MSVHRIRMLTVLAALGGMAVALAASPTSHATGAVLPTWDTAKGTGALVSVASPTGQFERNLQAMPALAADPVRQHILVAAANDTTDMPPCSKQASVTAGACGLPATPNGGGHFTPGVGMSGVYFSFDSGHNWIQPSYHGLTAAGCSPTVEPCTATPGSINTVPNYYENGLRTRGDASVAFGPVLKNGKFSWGNGSRLYLSTLATNLTSGAVRPGSIDSSSTVTVSHLDNPTQASVTDQSQWSAPVIVPKTEPSISTPTEDQIWADNAASSRHFGNVYTCYNDFHFPATGDVLIYPSIAASSDGGQTWTTHQIAPPIDSASEGYRVGCSIRTDSHGEVYAVFTHFPGTFPPTGATSTEFTGAQTLVTSLNGGATWTPPVDFMPVDTGCFYFDPTGDRCAEEGPGGTPNEPGPSLDIANGAPSGVGATNEIVLAWSDGRFGLNHEASLLSYSTDRGKTWSAPENVSLPGDRALYTAAAIAPDGSRTYLTYNAFTTPFATTTSTPRLLHGVLRSAAMGSGGAPADWTTDYVGRSGDARGTGFGGYNYEEFLGFYISAVATRSYGAGAWTDVSRAADCPAIDAWREASLKADTVVTPGPWPLADCPSNFGNSDIWSATTAP